MQKYKNSNTNIVLYKYCIILLHLYTLKISNHSSLQFIEVVYNYLDL